MQDSNGMLHVNKLSWGDIGLNRPILFLQDFGS